MLNFSIGNQLPDEVADLVPGWAFQESRVLPALDTSSD